MRFRHFLFIPVLVCILGDQSAVAQQVAHPDSLKQYQLRGRRAIKAGDFEIARDNWTKVLHIDPDNFEALLNLGTTFAGTGRNEQALVYFKRAYSIDSSMAELSNNLGAVYANLNRPDDAFRFYRRAISLDPAQARYHANYGLELIRAGRPGDALVSLRKADSLQPDVPVVLYATANAYASIRTFDSAEVYYTRASKAGGATAELLYFLGSVQQSRGNGAAADTSYRASLALDPDHKECRQALGILYLRSGQYTKATEQFERVIQLDRSFYAGVIALGVSYSMTRRFAEADSLLQSLYAVDTALAFQMLDLIDAEAARRRARE